MSARNLQNTGKFIPPEYTVPTKFGRPTKYDPSFCHALVEHMAKLHSFETFAAKLGVGRSSLYRWLEEHEEFRDAKDLGHQIAFQRWEAIGIQAAEGEIFGHNNAAWQALGRKMFQLDAHKLDPRFISQNNLTINVTDEKKDLLVDKLKGMIDGKKEKIRDVTPIKLRAGESGSHD